MQSRSHPISNTAPENQEEPESPIEALATKIRKMPSSEMAKIPESVRQQWMRALIGLDEVR